MDSAARSVLAEWQTFYLIVGSSAGALTGLQFVVMTLIADSSTRPTSPTIAAFGTPTILHFCAVLLVSALLCIPWSALSPVGLAVAACGGLGILYAVVIFRRSRRQEGYQPVLEDWVWHCVLPFIAYAVLLAGGLQFGWSAETALSLTATASLMLVFIGIHNAWDTTTYVAIARQQGPKESRARSQGNRR